MRVVWNGIEVPEAVRDYMRACDDQQLIAFFKAFAIELDRRSDIAHGGGIPMETEDYEEDGWRAEWDKDAQITTLFFRGGLGWNNNMAPWPRAPDEGALLVDLLDVTRFHSSAEDQVWSLIYQVSKRDGKVAVLIPREKEKRFSGLSWRLNLWTDVETAKEAGLTPVPPGSVALLSADWQDADAVRKEAWAFLSGTIRSVIDPTLPAGYAVLLSDPVPATEAEFRTFLAAPGSTLPVDELTHFNDWKDSVPYCNQQLDGVMCTDDPDRVTCGNCRLLIPASAEEEP